MVEMERADWIDLRQESCNENEASDTYTKGVNSTDVALRLRNMASVS